MKTISYFESISALMIPADITRNLPDGSHVEVAEFLRNDGIYEEVSSNLEELATYLVNEFGWSLQDLTQDQFGTLLQNHRKIIEPILKKIGPSLLRAYYTDPLVQMRIGVGDRPPFPEGRVVYGGELELLEPVFNRGPIFREMRDAE